MKFKIVDDWDYNDVNERFTNQANLDKHYNKHIQKEKEYEWTKEEYDKYSEILMNTPVNHKNIDGYVMSTEEGDRYCKYDKDTELFVVYRYNGDVPEAITAFKRPWRKYQGHKAAEYIDEIPQGK